MKSLIWVVGNVVAWILLVAYVMGGQDPVKEISPAPAKEIHVLVDQQPGAKPTVHLLKYRGAVGGVHLWAIDDDQPQPAAAPVDPAEKRKLDAIKKALEKK